MNTLKELVSLTGTLNKQQQEFANLKEQNRRTQQLTYSDPNKQPFKLLTQDRPSNLDQIKAQVEHISKFLTSLFDYFSARMHVS